MLTEYNQEQHYEALREEGREEAEAHLKPIIDKLTAESPLLRKN